MGASGKGDELLRLVRFIDGNSSREGEIAAV